jgi:hypothetical protein
MNKNYFKPKYRGTELIDKFSPDGNYRLVVTSYSTKKGCWHYSQGLIYSADKIEPLFEIQRNYSSFPYSWISHPNGHQYLVCGADYQGQTVLELDTGKRKDFVPEEAKKGVGFCWVEHHFDVPSKMLIVCGCVWACPYEFRFYDFSDPMNGWPELETEECVDEDNKWPSFEPDGTIKTYSTKSYDDDEDEDEESTKDKPEVLRATKTFVREGSKLRLLNENVSEEEKIHRQKNEEGWQKYNEKIKLFKESDPLYLCHDKLIKDKALSPEDHYGIGRTYKDWCPHFNTEERRFCRRVVNKNKTTIDLEWGMDTGPIKIVIYKKGKHFGDKWFEHSVAGMEEAFKEIKRQL